MKNLKTLFEGKIKKRKPNLLKLLVFMAMSAALLVPTSCNLGGDESEEKSKEKPTDKKAKDELVSDSGVPTGNGFSADVIEILPNGIKMTHGKLHVIPGKSRLDGSTGGSVFRSDKENKEYIYNHDSKIYFVVDLDKQDHLRQIMKKVNDYELVEVLGKEMINKLDCTKKKVRTFIEIMGMKRYTMFTIWQANGMEYPVRIEEEDGRTMELINISFKVPASKVFERPKGYTETDSYIDSLR